jgi:trehalose-6-phosphate synthase
VRARVEADMRIARVRACVAWLRVAAHSYGCTSQVFRTLPMREDLLRGVLSADLVSQPESLYT